MNNSVANHPSKLYVETTTRCNLQCSMCVKQADGACISEQDMSMEVFSALKPAFPYLDNLILNGIGEPLLTPHLEEMITLARASMPEDGAISFQTNGMLLTPERAEGLVQAGLTTICLSVDTVGEDGIFHGGEDVAGTIHAFSFLRKAAEKVGRPLRIGVEFVLMRDTVDALPNSIAWAADQGADFAIVTHMLQYCETMDDQELFNPNTEKSMAEFAAWQKEAKEKGIDLNTYYGVPWKFIRTKEEQEVLNFVSERHKQAVDKGIPAHFTKLMEWSTPEKLAEQAQLESILAKASEVAAEKGMEINLPPVSAKLERSCDFVEQGVAHITPEGDVRPCYFLWHEYSCYMDGHPKKVMPRTFGNVTEASILDIWNEESYRNFRSEVLGGSYLYCSNCAVMPCTDVVGKDREFVHDCVGLEVPCGHCMWNMGGVRCLL